MTTAEALKQMIGKTVKSIQHYEVIDVMVVFFTDDSSIHIKTKDESHAITVTTPNE